MNTFKLCDNIGISVYSLFDDKFPANVETVFCQKIGFEQRIYYFKDGYYLISNYSEEVVHESGGFKIKIIKTFYVRKDVEELNKIFPQKVNAIDIEKEGDIDMFYVYPGWKYFKTKVDNKGFHVICFQISVFDYTFDYEK